MSKRIKRNLPILKALFALKPSESRIFLCKGSNDLILALCEISLNVLKGNVPLTFDQYSKLNKQKKFIKLFANRKTVKHKRKVLTQTGGFLLPLLGAAVPFFDQFACRSELVRDITAHGAHYPDDPHEAPTSKSWHHLIKCT